MEITTKQLLVLDYIKKFIASHGYSPTVREICAGLSLRSPSTVQGHLKNLMTKGILTINPNKSRTIELLVENEYLNKDEDIVKLPVIEAEFLDSLSRHFLSLPKILLGGYDPKKLGIFKESDKVIYVINRALTPKDNDKILVSDGKSLYITTDKSNNIIGTVISEFKIY